MEIRVRSTMLLKPPTRSVVVYSGLLKKRRKGQNIFFSVSSFADREKESFLKFFDSVFQDSAKFREDLQKLREIKENS